MPGRAFTLASGSVSNQLQACRVTVAKQGGTSKTIGSSIFIQRGREPRPREGRGKGHGTRQWLRQSRGGLGLPGCWRPLLHTG